MIDQKESKVRKVHPTFYCLEIKPDGEIGIFINEKDLIVQGHTSAWHWKQFLKSEDKAKIKQLHGVDVDLVTN